MATVEPWAWPKKNSLFQDPYSECKPLRENVVPGTEPQYLAEAWRLIGNHHLYEGTRAAAPAG